MSERLTKKQREEHTRKMRRSYAESAAESLKICREWEDLDDDMLRALEELEDAS
jgi:hypothetical protein